MGIHVLPAHLDSTTIHNINNVRIVQVVKLCLLLLVSASVPLADFGLVLNVFNATIHNILI